MLERLRRVALAASILGSASCASNHHVSEWGDMGRPDLMLYAEQPDITTRLAQIDADSELKGLARDHELVANNAGTHYVVRSFVGTGTLGRTLHAIRIAAPSGVILALGPIAAGDTLRHEPTELVVSLAEPPGGDGATFFSMTDLTGRGTPAIITRSEDGCLTIFTLNPYGTVRLDVALEVAPTEVVDIDHDGHLDLRGHVFVAADDALRPDLVDVATFDGARYSNRTKAALAFHAMLRDERAGETPSTDAATRETRALERAWHAILAGDDVKKTLAKLDEEKPPRELSRSFVAYRHRIEKISAP